MTRNRANRRRERLLFPEEVADQFGVQPRTVVGWAKSGRLRFIRTPGGQYRFRPIDVDELMAIDDDTDEPLYEPTSNARRARPVLEHRDEPLIAHLA